MRTLLSEQLAADNWMIRQYRRFQGHDILDELGGSSRATSSSEGGGGLSPHSLLGTYHVDVATYINQPLLTTSTPQHAGLGLNMAGIAGVLAIGAQVALSSAVSGTYGELATNAYR